MFVLKVFWNNKHAKLPSRDKTRWYKILDLPGIKDKLPGGRYVVLVSMYDRIGGHVMRWSNLTGQQWSGSTLPLCHDGAFHSIELPVCNIFRIFTDIFSSSPSPRFWNVICIGLKSRDHGFNLTDQPASSYWQILPSMYLSPSLFTTNFSVNSTINLYQVDQSVFTVCPSVPDIRPSMVFVFEVFLLRGPMVPTDRVVAWGAFPLCDKECRLIFFQYLSRRMSQRS